MDITVDELLEQEIVSRYELARLLNAVECVDCIQGPNWMITDYDDPFWLNFIDLPGKDFDDITYLGGIFNEQSYYYCVAYVGDNEYMRGYPEEVSPICAGSFCGTRSVTKWEFLQVVINLIWQYIYYNYSVNRDNAQTWMQEIKPGTSQDEYLDANDRDRINQNASTCEDSCQLVDTWDFRTYMKYCMYNLDECQMQPWGNIWQAVWPVAELNVLFQQNIVDAEEAAKGDIHNPVAGSKVLEILDKIHELIGCTFDDDYDCDSLGNADDNCPNHYNPSQVDTDEDGIWDVCDSDIDNDGILNPIWIVDDLGRINIALADSNMDNCLLVVNTDQTMTQHPFMGNACVAAADQVGLYISVPKLYGNAPLTVSFDAITKWTVENIERNLGDGTMQIGQSISHTFDEPGSYVVSAMAKWPNNNAHAKVTILVGASLADQRAIQIKTNKLGGTAPLSVAFEVLTQWDIDYIEWEFSDTNQSIEKQVREHFSKVFSTTDYHRAKAKARKGNELVAISIVNIGGGKEGSLLQTSILNPEINQTVKFQWKVYRIRRSDIAYVQRDFGDQQQEQSNGLNIQHTYTYGGPKAVQQKIFLKDGNVLTNMITLYVVDPQFIRSSTLLITPSNLRNNQWETAKFTLSILGDKLNDVLTLSYQHAPGAKHVIDNPTTWPLVSSNYTYQQHGLFAPKASLFVNQCQILEAQATVVVQWIDQCLEALLNGTLGDFQCDMDQDGIPDVCDNDIDGDGVLNLVGIITYENPDCSITADNINFRLLDKHLAAVCTLDNCPFETNGQQLDLNANMIGDMCANDINDLYADYDQFGWGIENDRDQDGIIDRMDQCPDLPESINGIQDNDGCPEIGLELNCPSYGKPIFPVACNNNGICEVDESCTCSDCETYNICTNTFGEDNVCESGEDCESGKGCDNDDVCESSENCTCRDCLTYLICSDCGNGEINPGETCLTCPEDVWPCPSIECEDIICPAECLQCPCPYMDFANALAPDDQVKALLKDVTRTIIYNSSLTVDVFKLFFNYPIQ